ncbi:MAG: toll/interleukin-1 receptor domain-containing protein [Eubacterium sp.]|nr:toll/interleukin-1 receptor domain-containing protein [Eubacterium sp.]
MKYAAFISYRHDGLDEKAAVRIQKEIENYRIPKKIVSAMSDDISSFDEQASADESVYSEKKAEVTANNRIIGKVFRDADEFGASSDLSEAIREALDESEWLIAICSERYLESKWCMEEIDHFISTRGYDKIIVILLDGEPQTSFPRALTHIKISDSRSAKTTSGDVILSSDSDLSKQITTDADGNKYLIREPLAIDIRGSSEAELRKNIKREKLRIFSTMLGVDYDTLRRRQRERRNKRIAALASVLFIALAAFTAVITLKNIELGRAYDALDASNKETLRGESYYLSEYADAAYLNGDDKTAAMLALSALPEDLDAPDRPYVAQAMRSLTRALGIYDYSAGYKAETYIENHTSETYDTRSELSDDGMRLLIETYTQTAGNMLERSVRVCSLPDGEELCSYQESPVSRSYDHPAAMGADLSSDGKYLTFLSPDGLKKIEIDTGDEIYSGKRSSELRTGESEGVTVAIDYEEGRLYSYDEKGETVINAEIGQGMNYQLGGISPDEKYVCLAANTEDAFGIITINLSDGQNSFFDMPGICTRVNYIDDGRLLFLLSDETDGLKHIVLYDIAEGDRRYLCDADWDMTTMTVSGDNSMVYYYHENTLYEIDLNSKKGNTVWEKTYPSSVMSVAGGDGVVAVSCHDGTVYFYEEGSKRQISCLAGSSQSWYLMNLTPKKATLRDFWGSVVRVYSTEHESLISHADDSASGSAAVVLPDNWYACGASGGKFAMGFHSGAVDTLAVFDASDLTGISSAPLAQMGIGSFENKVIDMSGDSYVSITDYDDYTTSHFASDTLKETLELSDNDIYYYNETGDTIFFSKDRYIEEIDAMTGEKKNSYKLSVGCDRGVKIGDTVICGNDDRIKINRLTIKNAVLYAFNAKRNLIFYRSVDEKKWYVYDIKQKKNVLKGTSGNYSSTMFFGNNRYFLNDYSEVYDMETMKKVLDVSELGTSVYGVQTTDELPFFIVRCEENSGNASSGGSTGYLYEKDGSGEIVGDIPGYVTVAEDGDVIVFDGEKTLHKIKLYTPAQILGLAKDRVGAWQFTPYQREKYHLYS